jgi:hypothetical protein
MVDTAVADSKPVIHPILFFIFIGVSVQAQVCIHQNPVIACQAGQA